MKRILFLLLFTVIYLVSLSQATRKTPTGVLIYVEDNEEEFSDSQIAAGNAFWMDSIINAGWSADTLAGVSSTYNCHGYAWHMSDGGDTVRIPYEPVVAKYFNGLNATYKQVNNSGKYTKVYYNGAQHFAVVDPDYPNWVISKWGSGPLVRHLPNDCPYNDYYTYTLEYYELIMDSLPNSVSKGCAVDISTLDITGATYNWTGDNSYVCAVGNTSTGSVTGLNITPLYGKGEAKVKITSPYSQTTVKGIKEIAVTSQPASPVISGPTLVCSGGANFTLNNVPEGNAVTWSSSSNLSTSDPHTNPCTFVSIGNGSGWIEASVSTGCADNMFTISRYDVWSGAPVLTSMSGPTSTPNYQWAIYSADPYNSLMGLQTADYNWTLSPLNGNSLYQYGRYLDIAFYNSGYYRLVVNAENTCGTSGYLYKYINVYDAKSLSITPNPANGGVTVAIESTNKNELIVSEWDLEVFSETMLLKAKKTKLKGKSTTIQTAGWKEGIYMVRVKYKDEILTGKLIVKR